MIAEPFLYKHIEVDECDDHTLLRLLFTLINRTELAACISSLKYAESNFGVTRDVAKQEANQEKLRCHLWKHKNAIGEKIDELLPLDSDISGVSSWRLKWFSAIMSAVDKRHTGNDEVLALVLCMARKIKYLELYSGPALLMTTFRVLNSTWADSANPLTNLQHFTLNGHRSSPYTIAVLPTLQSLNINGALPLLSTNGTILNYPLPMPTLPVLYRVQFTRTENITPAVIREMVSIPAMSNLRELVVDRCGCAPPWFDSDMHDNNLVELLRTLEKHTPLLELFQWSNYPPSEGYTLFDTFNGLEHLRKLHIDADLLVPHGDTKLGFLSDPHAVFPEHLEELTLDAIRMRPLHKMIRAFHDKLEKAENMSEALQASLAEAARMFSLKRLSLIIPMESKNTFGDPYPTTIYELDPMDVTFFRYAADELKKLGVTLEVYTKAGFYEVSKKVLVKAGWTAPSQHSVGSCRDGIRYETLYYDSDE
jgi:hypothetical protein